MEITFEQFSRANRERCESLLGFNHPLAGWSTSDWMTATMGELGEAANVVKKLNRVRDGVPGNKQTADELRAQLRKELGDVFVYLDLMTQSIGVSIADAAVEVFNAKSAEIGYPESLKRYRVREDQAMDQLDVVISRWLREAKSFRAAAADCGDGEEQTLCEIEARRLELCVKEISEAFKQAKAS